MDYTPGAMINGTEETFRAILTQPMSMGTRCHQLAMYVVYESPLQMLCDNPSNYEREPECMEFLSAVPTVWDTTVVLSASIEEHVAIARKKDGQWFIGCMTNWDPREMELDFSFLGSGEYRMTIWRDGINADRFASDYMKEEKMISAGEKLTVKLAPGGGWVAIIGR
jgi:alpha-glucosidase